MKLLSEVLFDDPVTEWDADRDKRMSELAAHVRAAHFTEIRGEGCRRFSLNLDWRLGLLVLLAALALCAWGMSEAKNRMDFDAEQIGATN